MKIVLCSGYLSVAATVAAMRAGADRVVYKPETFREILARLEKQDEDMAAIFERPTLARAEWEHIMRVLEDCNGNVSMAAPPRPRSTSSW
jgi:two-component system response regulator RegA